MARVTSCNTGKTSSPPATLCMDQMTHGIIRETSKNLRHYLDVKRREDGFVLNSNCTCLNCIPLKARYMYGTSKGYPSSCRSHHSDYDVKVYLPDFNRQKRRSCSTLNSVEKQICREELNFHMHTNKYLPQDHQRSGGLHVGSSSRSYSCCSRSSMCDCQRRTSRTPWKFLLSEKDQLVEDTADLLASMIKTRQSVYRANCLSQQTSQLYLLEKANSSSSQADKQTHRGSPSLPSMHASTDLGHFSTIEQSQKPKRTTGDAFEKAASIMHKAKPITTHGLLCEYKISVRTGNCNGASTNASIYIRLYGTKGYTDLLLLDDSQTHRVPFLKDQTDLFIIQTDYVGELAGISIGHEGKDIRSDWFLSEVSIDDSLRETIFEIPCNAWLSTRSIDQKTMRDFQVTSMKSYKKRTDLAEHRNEIDHQDDFSITTEHLESTTIRSEDDHLIGHKQMTKHRKQHSPSIGSITIAKKRTSLSEITKHLSEPPQATTVESHFDRNEFASSPSIPRRPIPSPPISLSASETENEDHTANRHHSITPRSLSTLDHLQTRVTTDENSSETTNDHDKRHPIDQSRPPARLEKRTSPIPVPSARSIKKKEETNEDEVSDFFDN